MVLKNLVVLFFVKYGYVYVNMYLQIPLHIHAYLSKINSKI